MLKIDKLLSELSLLEGHLFLKFANLIPEVHLKSFTNILDDTRLIYLRLRCQVVAHLVLHWIELHKRDLVPLTESVRGLLRKPDRLIVQWHSGHKLRVSTEATRRRRTYLGWLERVISCKWGPS